MKTSLLPPLSLFLGAPKFDFVQPDGTPVKANGFRSLLCVLKELLSCLLFYLQKYARERGGLFYNTADSLSNITAHARALQVSIYSIRDGI